MKKPLYRNKTFIRIVRIILLLAILASARMIFAQNVTILPSGITPNQGGAVPRLSYDAIMALSAPKDGDMAYDISFHCMRLYQKDKWVKMLCDANHTSPSILAWQMGGIGFDMGSALTTDANGNVYVAGYFQHSAQFDDTVLPGNGIAVKTLFIAKYTNTGHLLWAKQAASGPGEVEVRDIALDASGNIFITGAFSTNITFGANTFTSSGIKDIFLAKYATDGALQWVQQAGGIYDDMSNGLAIDGTGNIYIAGGIEGTVTFGGAIFPWTGKMHAFVAKFKPDGTVEWLRRGVGTTGNDVANGVVADTNGGVTIVGNLTGTVSFEGTTMSSVGGTDVLLLRYDNAGNLAWLKKMGGAGADNGADIGVDTNNNLYILGNFELTANFDGKSLTSAGNTDIFILKMTDTGVLTWAKREGGTSTEDGLSIAIDTKQNFYITGNFENASTFRNTIIDSNGNLDIFIAKYSPNGELSWVQAMGGEYFEIPIKLAADTQGNVYATGYFYEKTSFGAYTLTGAGQVDAFVVRLRD
ncbi:NHL repeat-containing protein [Emticicia fontis]